MTPLVLVKLNLATLSHFLGTFLSEFSLTCDGFAAASGYIALRFTQSLPFIYSGVVFTWSSIQSTELFNLGG
jgi:hypothetical protein